MYYLQLRAGFLFFDLSKACAWIWSKFSAFKLWRRREMYRIEAETVTKSNLPLIYPKMRSFTLISTE